VHVVVGHRCSVSVTRWRTGAPVRRVRPGDGVTHAPRR
jgi:hypothetical protein